MDVGSGKVIERKMLGTGVLREKEGVYKHIAILMNYVMGSLIKCYLFFINAIILLV